MNIVEKEANHFFDRFYRRGNTNDLKNLKSALSTKLYDFNRDRDKLDFLKVLRVQSVQDRKNHMKVCKGEGCTYEEQRDIGIFVIDQEIDEINQYYNFEPRPDEAFSPSEEANLHHKLNEIIENLKKQGLGQEIIFEEIEELKNHFNLGKKNWFQLFKGKVIDLSIKKILNETIVKEIYDHLTEGFENVVKTIG